MGDLAGLTFLSTGVTQDGAPYDLVDGSRIMLQFTDSAMAANAGCNHMSGDASVTDGVLMVKGAGLAMTEMGCDPQLMDQDAWLADILTSKPTVTLDSDRLTVASGDIMIDFLDRETAEPDQPLVGTAWTLESLGTAGDDGSVSSVPGGVESTLQLAEDGSASIRPGCNTGRAKADAGDATITFGPIALTRMMCHGAQAEVEDAVLAVIDGEVGYVIDGSQLTLTKGNHTLTYRMADQANAAD